MSSNILIGGAAACVAVLGCGIASRSWSRMKRLSRLTGTSPFVYWPNGPFEVPMGRREAAKILSVSPFASAGQIKEAHRRIMLLNHPDRDGSPFLALKINEAKELLSRQNQ